MPIKFDLGLETNLVKSNKVNFMKNRYILYSIFIFLIACKNEIKNNNMLLIPVRDSVYFELGKKESNNSSCIQYLSNKDSDYLFVLNEYQNSIDIYNIGLQKRIKEIILEKDGENAFPGLLSFVVKNMDTIILISPMPQAIGIIDGKGELIKKISYEKDRNNKKINPTFTLGGTKAILNANSLNLIQQYRADESSGILTSSLQKHTNVAFSVNLDNNIIQLLPIVYPKELIGKDISNMKICRELGYNNCLIYFFNITDQLFVSEELEEFKKIQIATNYELKLPENMNKYMQDMMSGLKYSLQRDDIYNIRYDKYREVYYIIVRKRSNDASLTDDIKTKFVFPNCLIIILDKNFKHLGETYFPDNIYAFQKMFITRKGVYISEDHINNPSFNEDIMRFRLFKLVKNENL